MEPAVEPARADPALGAAGYASPVRVHAIPAFYRVVFWGCAAGCAAAFVACLAVPFFTAGAFDYLYLAFAGALVTGELALLTASAALRLRMRFVVKPARLLRIGPGDRYDLLRWDEIVRIRERPLLQRLEVSDRKGRVFFLDYQLDGFSELAGELAVRAPAAWRGDDELASPAFSPVARVSGATFQRHWYARVFPAAVAPLVIVGSIAIFGGVLILAWLIALALGAAWLGGWWSVRLAPREIVIAYPFRTRRIPVADVAAMDLEVDLAEGRRGGRGVVLYLAGGSVVSLRGVREGDVALYGALRRQYGIATPEELSPSPEDEWERLEELASRLEDGRPRLDEGLSRPEEGRP